MNPITFDLFADAEPEQVPRREQIGEQSYVLRGFALPWLDQLLPALETVLTQKGYIDPAALDVLVDTYQTQIGPRNGARVVARAWADPAFAAFVDRMIPMGELATPDHIAAAVVYLASPAAAMITGHSLVIDGGWTAK